MLAALVAWLRAQPPATYDLRLVSHCLAAQGLPVNRSGPRTLSANGAVVVRLDSGGHVAFHSDDGRVRSCLDRVAGRHLRLRR